jgi:hypothetical protein
MNDATATDTPIYGRVGRTVLEFDSTACVQFNTTAIDMYDEAVRTQVAEQELQRRASSVQIAGSAVAVLSSAGKEELRKSKLRTQYRHCARRLAVVDPV